MGVLVIHKLADTSEGERVKKFDPETGAPKLVNPATPGDDHEPWPLAGVEIVGEVPDTTALGQDYVEQACAQGWMSKTGPGVEVVPGGPPGNPWAVKHVFMTAETVTIHTDAGDVKYRVVENPGKHEDSGEPSGYRIEFRYLLERDNG